MGLQILGPGLQMVCLLSFCGIDRRWWVDALSRSAGDFLSNSVRSYFLTSGVCLQARDYICLSTRILGF